VKFAEIQQDRQQILNGKKDSGEELQDKARKVADYMDDVKAAHSAGIRWAGAQRYRESFFAGCLKEDERDCLIFLFQNCRLMAHYRHNFGHLLTITDRAIKLCGGLSIRLRLVRAYPPASPVALRVPSSAASPRLSAFLWAYRYL
jgi:hypothetical protein